MGEEKRNGKIPALLVIGLLVAMPCASYYLLGSNKDVGIGNEDGAPIATNAILTVVKTGEYTRDDLIMAVSSFLLDLPKNFFLGLLPYTALVRGVDIAATIIVDGLYAWGVLSAEEVTLAAIMGPVQTLLAGIAAAAVGLSVGGIIATILSLGAASPASVPTTTAGIVAALVAAVASSFITGVAN